MTDNNNPQAWESLCLTEPVLIHKIDKKSYWIISDDLDDRAREAVNLIFNNEDDLYSFWKIGSDQELSSVAMSINAGRGSLKEQIDFIWVAPEEIERIGIELIPKLEGECFQSQKLHYDAILNKSLALELCKYLMSADDGGSHQDSGRVLRLKKGKMKRIAAYMESKACRVFLLPETDCECIKI